MPMSAALLRMAPAGRDPAPPCGKNLPGRERLTPAIRSCGPLALIAQGEALVVLCLKECAALTILFWIGESGAVSAVWTAAHFIIHFRAFIPIRYPYLECAIGQSFKPLAHIILPSLAEGRRCYGLRPLPCFPYSTGRKSTLSTT